MIRLEEQANSKSGDSAAQAAFLQELGKSHPEVVIQRVQSQRFAANEQVFKEYIKALTSTKRLDQIALYDLLKVIFSTFQNTE